MEQQFRRVRRQCARGNQGEAFDRCLVQRLADRDVSADELGQPVLPLDAEVIVQVARLCLEEAA